MYKRRELKTNDKGNFQSKNFHLLQITHMIKTDIVNELLGHYQKYTITSDQTKTLNIFKQQRRINSICQSSDFPDCKQVLNKFLHRLPKTAFAINFAIFLLNDV